jgi:hypothetical protein
MVMVTHDHCSYYLMKAKLLLALSLFCVSVAKAIEKGLWFLNTPSQWPHMNGYIELKNGKVIPT